MKKITFLAVPVIALTLAVATLIPVSVSATSNDPECTVAAVGTKNTAGNADSRFKLNGDGTVTATFEVKSSNVEAECAVDVLLASWQAPDADKGRPYDQQKLYKYVKGTFDLGKHTLTVALPNCYYQVDLVRGTEPTGPNGSPVYEQGRMMGSLHGGTQKCEEPKVTTPTPSTPQVAGVTTLPKTGPANLFGLFAGTSALGAAAHHLVARRRASHK